MATKVTSNLVTELTEAAGSRAYDPVTRDLLRRARDAIQSHHETISSSQTQKDFFSKHALGPLARPSCLVCGQTPRDWPPGIQHAELPGIVVCTQCRDAGQKSAMEISTEPYTSKRSPLLDGESITCTCSHAESYHFDDGKGFVRCRWNTNCRCAYRSTNETTSQSVAGLPPVKALHQGVSAWYANWRMQIPHDAAVELANFLAASNPFTENGTVKP